MSMDFKVEYGSIEIFQAIPDEFKSLRIPGAYQQLIQTDFLKLLVRLFPGTGYHCYLTNYLVDESGGMGARENKPLLEFCYTLEGRLTGKMDGIDNAELAPGTFNIRYTPHVETKAKFKKGMCCTTFDIHVERVFLESFRLKHPVMGYFLDQADNGQPVELLKHSPKANWIMRNAINEIVNNNFPPEHEQQMRDAYVAIILSNALKATLSLPQTQKLITLLPHQENAMERLKELIDKSTVQLSNEALCAMTNLSEETVVAGFRHMFGMTPHDYQIDKKFKQIEQLLTKTDETIQSIALTAGYGQAANLNKEFKKRYNCTPTEYRDEHK